MSVESVSGDQDDLRVKGRAPFDQALLNGAVRLCVDADGAFDIHIDLQALRNELNRDAADVVIGAEHLEIYYVANGLVDDAGLVVRGGQKRASVDLGISPSKVSRLTRKITPIGQTRPLPWTKQGHAMLGRLLDEI